MKYLVVKGYEGFGDRLQCLSYALSYALQHGLTVCVDWNDPLWTHDDASFHSYFKLRDVEFIERPGDLPEGASVHPPYWQDRISQPLGPWVYDWKSHIEITLEQPYRTDVVVHSAVGFRRYDAANLVRCLRLQPFIRDAFLARLKDIRSPFVAVHLRGTDRARGASRGEIAERARQRLEALPAGSYEDIVTVCDDRALLAEWMALVPHARAETGFVDPISRIDDGTHFLTREQLAQSGLEKREMNRQLLIDFLLLVWADQSVASHDDSTFHQMARALRTRPDFARILETEVS